MQGSPTFSFSPALCSSAGEPLGVLDFHEISSTSTTQPRKKLRLRHDSTCTAATKPYARHRSCTYEVWWHTSRSDPPPPPTSRHKIVLSGYYHSLSACRCICCRPAFTALLGDEAVSTSLLSITIPDCERMRRQLSAPRANDSIAGVKR